MRSTAGQRGQATVEFVALLPVLVAVALALWQAVLAGQAASLAASAARAAARAQAVGGEARAGARSVLPARLERGLRVRADRERAIRVDVPIPAVLVGARLGRVSAQARFREQGG